MANGLVETRPEFAEELLGELERASVANDGAAPAGTVQMGTDVEYRTEDGNTRRITLVYPAEANIAERKV
jgi:regulator of nucleoside diphosphate kinase